MCRVTDLRKTAILNEVTELANTSRHCMLIEKQKWESMIAEVHEDMSKRELDEKLTDAYRRFISTSNRMLDNIDIQITNIDTVEEVLTDFYADDEIDEFLRKAHLSMLMIEDHMKYFDSKFATCTI